jgi:hypothetical protein
MASEFTFYLTEPLWTAVNVNVPKSRQVKSKLFEICQRMLLGIWREWYIFVASVGNEPALSISVSATYYRSTWDVIIPRRKNAVKLNSAAQSPVLKWILSRKLTHAVTRSIRQTVKNKCACVYIYKIRTSIRTYSFAIFYCWVMLRPKRGGIFIIPV